MAIIGLVSSLAGFVKVRYLIDKAIIDNIVFRCHYRVTSAILFLCCIIVTANNLIGKNIFLTKNKTNLWSVLRSIIIKPIIFIGDPISCINDGAVPGHVINTYCWITYTFTLPHQQGQPKGSHVAHPGLGNYVDNEEETRYHSYYQWVPFMLFFQVKQNSINQSFVDTHHPSC